MKKVLLSIGISLSFSLSAHSQSLKFKNALSFDHTSQDSTSTDVLVTKGRIYLANDERGTIFISYKHTEVNAATGIIRFVDKQKKVIATYDLRRKRFDFYGNEQHQSLSAF